jgi:hypothetical protein
MSKFEYRRVSTHTLAGLKAAEKLQAAGWRIISSGLFTILFERAVR